MMTDDMADAVTQKALHRDARVLHLRVGQIHDGSSNAVAEFIRMRRIDFFKHNLPSFHSKSPGRQMPSEASFSCCKHIRNHNGEFIRFWTRKSEIKDFFKLLFQRDTQDKCKLCCWAKLPCFNRTDRISRYTNHLSELRL